MILRNLSYYPRMTKNLKINMSDVLLINTTLEYRSTFFTYKMSHFKTNLKKSRSVDSLSVTDKYNTKREKTYERFCDYFTSDNHSRSDSSHNICVIIDDHSDTSSIDREQLDSGVTNNKKHDEGLSALDHKITKLSDMLQEQHLLLTALKEDLCSTKLVTRIQQPDLLKDSANTLDEFFESTKFDDTKLLTENVLETIKETQVENIETNIRDALIEFLKSDDLKNHIASATSESVKKVISECFSESFPSLYLPVMEQSHRRLLSHVTRTLEKAFNELEAGSSSLYKSVYNTSRSLCLALEKHLALPETKKIGNIFENFQGTLELILKNELREWREKVLGVIKPHLEAEENVLTTDVDCTPTSPPQPADPERSIIDQLMKSAEINKQIKDGDINKSFEKALTSSDLSLVMAACRAADPDEVFAPCRLAQPVLLSLVQQLATDMVHDTQLKCRYLEEAIINLKPFDQTTRVYLPLVVGEVRKHLSKFLKSFPSHVASRRITLIIMAANNLLK